MPALLLSRLRFGASYLTYSASFLVLENEGNIVPLQSYMRIKRVKMY